MLTILVDIFLHLDKHLAAVISQYGIWIYPIFFVIIFCETGLVVTPFLPGDSLLFAAGALAAVSADNAASLDLITLLIVLGAAAVLGNVVNYQIGYFVGPKVFHKKDTRFFKTEYLQRTHEYFERYGPVTIVIARFMPIIRTFAPFLAGIGRMSYMRFTIYNLAGCLAWVGAFVLGGYFFGNIPVVKKNFSVVIMVIVIISLMPSVIAYFKHRSVSKKAA